MTSLYRLVLIDMSVRDENGEMRYGNLFADDLENEYQQAITKVFTLRRRLFARDGK